MALDTLDADERNLALRLAAFPADASVPVDLLASCGTSRSRMRTRLVDRLAAKDLVTCAEDRVVLHDHVHDFLVLESRAPASDVHLRLWELAEKKRQRGWGALADDSPYLWDRLAWHACRAGLNRRTLGSSSPTSTGWRNGSAAKARPRQSRTSDGSATQPR